MKRSILFFFGFLAVTSIFFFIQNFKSVTHQFNLQFLYSGRTNIGQSGMNVHIWDGVCLKDITKICKLPIFPKAPALRNISRSSIFVYPFQNTLVRVFGFILPKVAGIYRFKVDLPTQHSPFVFLLNNNHVLTRMKHTSSSSEQVRFEGGEKYFFELLYAQGSEKTPNVTLMWQTPGEYAFSIIESSYLSIYINDSEKRTLKVHDPDIPSSGICDSSIVFSVNQTNPHFKWEKEDYIEHTEVADILPECEYKPSYVSNRTVRYRWEGIDSFVYDMEIWQYPLPQSKEVYDRWKWPYPLSQSTADQVTQQYMNKLETKFPG